MPALFPSTNTASYNRIKFQFFNIFDLSASHLIVGEVCAGDGWEGAAGWPGEDVLTLPGRVDAGLGEDRDHIPAPASALELGRVGETELVD